MSTHFLAVLLGAEEFPEAGFKPDPAFGRAHAAFRGYLDSALGLPPEDVLDLFNSNEPAETQDHQVGTFLRDRVKSLKAAGRDVALLLYYVGHGDFSGQDFYFVLRRTRKTNPLISSMTGRSLSETIKREALWIKTCAVLDACFSAAATRLFQSSGEQIVARSFVGRGLSFFCSAPADAVSYLLPDGSGTAFTDGLVASLREGRVGGPRLLSLRQVADLTWTNIERQRAELGKRLGEKGVAEYFPPRPQVHSTVTPDGDLADFPLFPNPGWRDGTAQNGSAATTPDAPPTAAEVPASAPGVGTGGAVPAPGAPGSTTPPLLATTTPAPPPGGDPGRAGGPVRATAAKRDDEPGAPERAERERAERVEREATGVHPRALDTGLIKEWMDRLLQQLRQEDERAADEFKQQSRKIQEMLRVPDRMRADLRAAKVASELKSARRRAAKGLIEKDAYTTRPIGAVVTQYEHEKGAGRKQVSFAAWVYRQLDKAERGRSWEIRWERWLETGPGILSLALAVASSVCCAAAVCWCVGFSPVLFGEPPTGPWGRRLVRGHAALVLSVYLIPGLYLLVRGGVGWQFGRRRDKDVAATSAVFGAIVSGLGVWLSLGWGYPLLSEPGEAVPTPWFFGILVGLPHVLLVVLLGLALSWTLIAVRDVREMRHQLPGAP